MDNLSLSTPFSIFQHGHDSIQVVISNTQHHPDCHGLVGCSTEQGRGRGYFSIVFRKLWEVAATRESFSDKYLGIEIGSNLTSLYVRFEPISIPGYLSENESVSTGLSRSFLELVLLLPGRSCLLLDAPCSLSLL